MAAACKWLGFCYNLPASPSKGRVYVWRKLKELGAVPLRSGMAVLPNRRENVERFRLLGERVQALQGDFLLIQLEFLSPRDEQQLLQAFEAQAQEDCQRLARQLSALGEEPSDPDQVEHQVGQLLREYSKVRRRQAVPTSAWQELENRMTQFAQSLGNSAYALSTRLQQLMDKYL